MAGRSKRTFRKAEFEDKIFDYVAYIKQNSTEIPTFYGFYRFVRQSKECSYRTIRRCFDVYWPLLKKTFHDIQADLIVDGACKGRYNVTVSIYFLKRYCGWTDRKQETRLISSDNLVDALSRSLEDENRVLRSSI